MMRQSGENTASAADDDEDDDYSDDDDDDDDDDDGLTRTANNLKVFCCSSTEFLKLSGKLTKDGPAQVRLTSVSGLTMSSYEFFWNKSTLKASLLFFKDNRYRLYNVVIALA